MGYFNRNIIVKHKYVLHCLGGSTMNRTVKLIIIFIFTFYTMMLFCANFSLGLTTFTKGNILLHLNIILKNFDIVDTIIGIIIYFTILCILMEKRLLKKML